MALAPFVVTLGKVIQAVLVNTVRMPEGINEIAPLLSPIIAYRTVKALENIWKRRLEQGNQVVSVAVFCLEASWNWRFKVFKS